MNGYYSQLIKILKDNGFSFLRSGKGSHELWGERVDSSLRSIQLRLKIHGKRDL